MVRVKINGTEYEVRTKWEEVDPDRLMACETFREELQCMSSIPKEIIDKAADVQLFPFYTLISFIDDTELPMMDAVNIEQGSYELLELAKTNMQTGKAYNKILKAARIYYPDEKNTVRLLALGVSIVHQIEIFLSKYSEMIESEPDNDSIVAGIDQLQAFGAWGTAFNLAGNDVLKLKAVLQMKAIEVYEALRYNFREAKYKQRLFDIKHPKK